MIQGLKQETFDLDLFYNLTYGEKVSRQYWMDRHDVDKDTIDNIDWDTLEKSTRKWFKGRAKWLTKSLGGISATGRVMERRKEWDHNRCPRCN